MGFNDIFQIVEQMYGSGLIDQIIEDGVKKYGAQDDTKYDNMFSDPTPIHTYEVAGIHYEVFAVDQLL